jgi:hypothetical protein
LIQIKNPKYKDVLQRNGEIVMAEKNFEHGVLKAGFSGAVAIGWLVFLILFLAFYSGGFHANEKFAIILLSLLIITVLLGGLWAFWSLSMMSKKDWEVFKVKGFKWRIIGSIIYGLALLIFLIYGFWYVWTDFGFWQYLAIILVVLLVSGGIMGVLWASWSAKNKAEMEKCGKEFGEKFEKGFKESFEKKDEKK